MAIALDRSGRDARGMGGGAPVLEVVREVAVSLTAFAVLESAGLFIP